MKRIWTLIVAALALITIGTVTIGDRFIINVFDWKGLQSYQQFSPQFPSVNDIVDFEVHVDGNQTYLEQRSGIRKVTTQMPANVVVYASMVYHPRGAREHIVVAGSDERFYNHTGDARNWRPIKNAAGTDSTFGTMQYSNFVQFKDTLIGTGGAGGSNDSIFCFASYAGADTLLQKVKSYVWPYGRILLHQDRIYGYGISYTGSLYGNKLVWMPEFDIVFSNLDTTIGTGYVKISENDGDFLTNVVPLGEHLVAYKSHAIFNLLIGSETNKPDQVIKVTDNIGAVCYDAVCSYNNVHYFVSQDGVYSYDGSKVTKISQPLDQWFADSLVHVKTIESYYIRIEAVGNRLYMTLPLHNVGNKLTLKEYRIFVYDFQSQFWWKMIPRYTTASLTCALLRYDYSDGVGTAFNQTTDNVKYRSRLLIGMDSGSTGATFFMFPGDYSPNGKCFVDFGGRTNSTLTTSLSPVNGNMWDRKQLERVALFGFGEPNIACTVKVDWYGEANTIIDSTKIPLTSSPSMVLKRLPPTISGQLLKMRIRTNDTALVKINAMQIIGSQKGLGNDQ